MGDVTGTCTVPLGYAAADEHFWNSHIPRRYNRDNDIGNNWKNDISRYVRCLKK